MVTRKLNLINTPAYRVPQASQHIGGKQSTMSQTDSSVTTSKSLE